MYTLEQLKPLIIEWANERDLIHAENADKQRLKLIEECGELASAILKNDVQLQKDSIGDIFVVLIILSAQLEEAINIDGFTETLDSESEIDNLLYHIIYNAFYHNHSKRSDFDLTTDFLNDICLWLVVDLTECANLAWNEIKNRKGQTVNGTFIKD